MTARRSWGARSAVISCALLVASILVTPAAQAQPELEVLGIWGGAVNTASIGDDLAPCMERTCSDRPWWFSLSADMLFGLALGLSIRSGRRPPPPFIALAVFVNATAREPSEHMVVVRRESFRIAA